MMSYGALWRAMARRGGLHVGIGLVAEEGRGVSRDKRAASYAASCGWFWGLFAYGPRHIQPYGLVEIRCLSIACRMAAV